MFALREVNFAFKSDGLNKNICNDDLLCREIMFRNVFERIKFTDKCNEIGPNRALRID